MIMYIVISEDLEAVTYYEGVVKFSKTAWSHFTLNKAVDIMEDLIDEYGYKFLIVRCDYGNEDVIHYLKKLKDCKDEDKHILLKKLKEFELILN